MGGDEPEVRKKHHRSPEDGVEEGSKRRKHSHRHRSSHRHRHHRHRSSKHDDHDHDHDETKHDGEEDHDTSLLPLPADVAVSSPNSRPGEDKEEGEIFDEEDCGGVASDRLTKRKADSDAESGEIMSEEGVGKSDHKKNLGIDSDAKRCPDKAPEKTGLNLNVLPEEDDANQVSPVDAWDNSDHRRRKSSDMNGDARHGGLSSRDSSPSYVNGKIDENHVEDRKKHRGSKHAKKGSDKGKSRKDVEEGVLSRRGRSRSPVDREDRKSRKHRKTDDSVIKTAHPKNDEEYNSENYGRHSDSFDNVRNDIGNCNKSISPVSTGNKNKVAARSPSYDRYHDESQKSRSSYHDQTRERSLSRNHLHDGRAHHAERDVKTYDQVKQSDSRDKVKDDSNRERIGRYDREDHRRERERSSSYSRHSGREERHGSRDTRDGDRDREKERIRERERERERERVRDRDSDRDRDRDRVRDRDMDRNRGRDRHRETYRDSQRSRDGYMDSRYSKHDESENQRENSRAKGSGSRNVDLDVSAENLKRDEDEQEDYEEKVELKLAEQEEDDIEKIKEESRRRRQAIMEKYKQKQAQQKIDQQVDSHSGCQTKEEKGSVAIDMLPKKSSPPKAPTNVAPESCASKNDGTDVDASDDMFILGKSTPQNGKSGFERNEGAGGLGHGTPKSERSADMFCDDIFAESPTGVRKTGKGDAIQVERSGLNDNWDDAEGYYSYRFGEILDGRYEVIAAHGKGVFSTVVRAKDLKAGKDDPEEVAIKIIRNNDTMYKAGLDELVILKKLAGADPEDRRHCVRFLSSFKYRNHLCLVFESLHMNLREVLKKFGRNIGLKLTAVRTYAKQLFIALKHLRNCGVLHCDIKPDNMLVNEAKNVLKLCDFGNAMFAGKNEITPYLVSRFYRAPEIVLGLSYDHPMDIWSVGCCLYELYSGKVLFPGPSNNDMLRLHMELKGPFPKKMLRKGAFSEQHFDQDMNFHSTEEDPVTKKMVKRLLLNIKPKDISTIITSSPGEDPKMLANFKDLLERIFVLDPDKRMTVSQALSHPFITGK